MRIRSIMEENRLQVARRKSRRCGVLYKLVTLTIMTVPGQSAHSIRMYLCQIIILCGHAIEPHLATGRQAQTNVHPLARLLQKPPLITA